MSRTLSDRWDSDRFGDRLIVALLVPLSWLYAVGWQIYLSIYRLGIKKSKAPHRPVVCVGNLVAGGTGKSPMTVHLASLLRKMGYQVVIGASGYGSPSSEAAQVAPAGPLDARAWGDEPAMLRELLPDVPLIVGRRRVLATEICSREFPGAVLLMDDGFQHLPVHKDLTILLDPPRRNRRCLPAGPYREPRRNRKRADLVIPEQFRFHPEPLAFVGPESFRQDTSDGKLHGWNAADLEVCATTVSVLCAIANPSRLLDSLSQAGLQLGTVVTLPDHDKLDAGNLFDALPVDIPVVVTLKDWVKIRERSDWNTRTIWIAKHEIHVEPEQAFRDWLAARMNELTKK